jgi:hypothetical protein
MGNATRLLEATRNYAAGMFAMTARRLNDTSAWLKPETRISHLNDGAVLGIFRRRPKSGTVVAERFIRMGPNHVHAFVTHPDGTITDCGVSKNLLTNIGDMVLQGAYGGAIPAGGVGSPATATSATSLTATGTPWTASNLGTPQLGLAGFRVYAPVTSVGTAPVYMNVVSNTTSVITGDQWWTAADGVGTTPASTNAFIIGAGGIASVRSMGLSTNSSAASATDTTLASELTSNGLARALATFARGSNPSGGSGTFTLQKAFSITGGTTTVEKMGLFVCLTSAGADPMIFEDLLNAAATVVSGDTLTVTDTVTLSG